MRSKWKGPIFCNKLFNSLQHQNTIPQELDISKQSFKIYNRATWIINRYIKYKNNIKLYIHKGKKFKLININPLMSYHRMGEFVRTRKKYIYRNRKKKK